MRWSPTALYAGARPQARPSAWWVARSAAVDRSAVLFLTLLNRQSSHHLAVWESFPELPNCQRRNTTLCHVKASERG
jgi:hypothetical protein